jgi:hypothetical protein
MYRNFLIFPDGKITTRWYAKECASLTLINYHSNHSLSQKINVMNNLIKRVLDVSSNIETKDALTIVSNILQKNDYPTSLIRKVFFKFINSKSKDLVPTENKKEDKKYLSLTNIPIVSSKISNIVKKSECNIKIVLRNNKTVNDLFSHVKDKTDKMKHSKVVYDIVCSCGLSYVGLTFKQTLGIRMHQHMNDCKLIVRLAKECNIDNLSNIKKETRDKIASININMQENIDQKDNKILRGKLDRLVKLSRLCEKSGLTSHFSETGHQIDFPNIKILERSNSRFKLGVLEMCRIKQKKGLNKCKDTDNLDPSYFGIIEKTN